jgi:uncharacterized protein YqeY
MLKKQIQENLNSALKEKKELEVSVLRLLSAAIFNKEKEKRYKLSKRKSEVELEKMGKESKEAEELEKESTLIDEEVIDVISSEIKKRKEAIVEFEKGDREDLVKKEKAEMEILTEYLPEQLSEEEIKKLATEVIGKTDAKEIKDMGKVMASITPQVKGKADMSLVSKIVKESLTQK